MIGPLARPLAQSASNSLLAGAGGGSAFSPSQLTGLVQRFLDANPTYYASTLNSYPILTPEETGTVAVPRAGRCWTFDGANDLGVMASTISALDDFTVACWIKPTQYGMILGGPTNSEYIWLESSTVMTIAAVSITHGHTFPLNQWAHVAVVRSGGVIAIYKNGVAGTATGVNAGAMAFSLVGQFQSGYAYGGSLSDIRIYNVAKSAGEIAAIYNQASTPNTIDTTGLLAHYPCAEESGTIGYDASGNSKHLTLTNITQATFHAADTGVKWSLPNQKGYTLANNLLLSSQAFSTSSPWNAASGGMTFSANAATDPLGGSAAEVATWTSGGTPFMYQTVSSLASATRYTFSIWLRAQSGTVVIGLREAQSNTSTTVTATTTWQRFTWTVTTTTTAVEIGIDQRTGVVPGVTANGTVELWGAQLELGSTASPYAATTSTALSNVVIPASLSTPSQDAAVTGPVCYPATVEVPCVTGDGSAVYVDLGSALIPASADFTTTLKYYHVTNNTARRIIACQDDAGHSTGAWYLYANISGGAPTAGAVWFSVQGASSVSVTSALTAGAWHDITISRAGSTFTLTVTAVGGSAVTANATMAPTILVTNTWLLKRNDATAYHNDGRISDLRITTGGVTKYFPLQEGPGSSNTNRDLYYCKSDGTSGTVSGAIVNGTVSTIWANRCPNAQDWSINYGGSYNPNMLSNTNGMITGWVPVAASLTANAAANPIDGSINATAMTESATTAFHYNYASVNTISGTTYTFSVHAKANGRNFLGLIIQGALGDVGAYFDLSNGTFVQQSVAASPVAYSITALANGWYRFSVTVAQASTIQFPFVILSDGVGVNPGRDSYAGNGTSGVFIFGAQFEPGSAATPYQATTTAVTGAFVPGRIGSSNDAAGNAKTLVAGKFGNPYSRLCPNAWAAPALVNIGYTASSKLAPTDTVQATSPADTKFRRNASTGSDRYFATLAALTGSDKTNAETYAG